LVIYNIPGRSVVDVSDDTLARLASLKRIVALKDATGDLARPLKLRHKLGKLKDKFIQLSGEDATALPFNIQGGSGCISVTANIAPKMCAELQNLWFKGEIKKAQALNDKLLPLHQAMFCETSPSPVKYAAGLMGICKPDLRLPLVGPSEENKAKVKKALLEAGLI